MREEKENVRNFYDTFGWNRGQGGVYNDTAVFTDTQSSPEAYYGSAHRRLASFVPPGGKYYLDAGSGAINHPAAIEIASGFERHVCVDFSVVALREARAKLGSRGVCVMGDLAHLPFLDDSIDASLCQHVLYHVPADEQGTVLGELRRTLKRGGRCIVIYRWPDCLATRFAQFAAVAGASYAEKRKMYDTAKRAFKHRLAQVPGLRRIKRAFIKSLPPLGNDLDSPSIGGISNVPPLFCQSLTYQQLRAILPREWKTRLRIWRAADEYFTGVFGRQTFVGRCVMYTLMRLEQAFPRALVRVGKYPLIIIDK